MNYSNDGPKSRDITGVKFSRTIKRVYFTQHLYNACGAQPLRHTGTGNMETIIGERVSKTRVLSSFNPSHSVRIEHIPVIKLTEFCIQVSVMYSLWCRINDDLVTQLISLLLLDSLTASLRSGRSFQLRRPRDTGSPQYICQVADPMLSNCFIRVALQLAFSRCRATFKINYFL